MVKNVAFLSRKGKENFTRVGLWKHSASKVGQIYEKRTKGMEFNLVTLPAETNDMDIQSYKETTEHFIEKTSCYV